MNDINLRTKRLIIKPLILADSQSLFKYRSLDEVTRFQEFNPNELADVVSFINSMAVVPNTLDTWYQLGIFLKDGTNLIGDIGIHFLINQDDTELGCTIAPQYWGQGYATEGLAVTIYYILKTLKKKRIIAYIDANNLKSRRLFERLGFQLVSQKKGQVMYQTNNWLQSIGNT